MPTHFPCLSQYVVWETSTDNVAWQRYETAVRTVGFWLDSKSQLRREILDFGPMNPNYYVLTTSSDA